MDRAKPLAVQTVATNGGMDAYVAAGPGRDGILVLLGWSGSPVLAQAEAGRSAAWLTIVEQDSTVGDHEPAIETDGVAQPCDVPITCDVTFSGPRLRRQAPPGPPARVDGAAQDGDDARLTLSSAWPIVATHPSRHRGTRSGVPS